MWKFFSLFSIFFHFFTFFSLFSRKNLEIAENKKLRKFLCGKEKCGKIIFRDPKKRKFNTNFFNYLINCLIFRVLGLLNFRILFIFNFLFSAAEFPQFTYLEKIIFFRISAEIFPFPLSAF